MVLHWGRLSSKGHLAMSGDITCCHSLGGVEHYWHLWAEAKDASKHPEMHRTTPYNKELSGASLLAQWLGVHLPMQGTRVRAPVREDPACRGVAGPVGHGR